MRRALATVVAVAVLLVPAHVVAHETQLGLLVWSGDVGPAPAWTNDLGRHLDDELGYFLDLHGTRIHDASTRGAILDCGTAVDCMAKSFEAAGYERGLVAAVVNSESTVEVAILVVDVRSESAVVKHFAEVDKQTSEPAFAVAREIRRALVRARHVVGAKVRLRGVPASAGVVFDAPSRSLDGRELFLVDTSAKELRATGDGYETATRRLSLVAGETSALDLRLEPTASVFVSPWLWIAVGVVVAGAATAVVTVAAQPDRVTGLCQGADATCGEPR